MNNYSLPIFVSIAMPVLLLFLRKMALKLSLVDQPNARKIHSEAVPLIGGLALYIMALILLFVNLDAYEFIPYLMFAASFVVLIGLLDDVLSLSAAWRFAIQICASLLVIYFAQVKLSTFGYLLWPNWDMQLGVFSIPITVFGVVGVINAINMADGIDGLAAMTFFSPVLVMILLAGNNPQSLWLLMLLLCVLIFVIFNKSQVLKVFLGDNGSMLLGFILAWLLVYYSQDSETHKAIINPVTALYLVALPIIDTIFVMLRRLLKGDSPFKPDKTHLHHYFLARGYSQTVTLLAMMTCQLLLIGLGILLLLIRSPEYLQFYIFVGLSAIYYYAMSKMWFSINH